MEEKDKTLEEPQEPIIGGMPKKTAYLLIGLVVITILLLVLAIYNFNLVGKLPGSQNTAPAVAQATLTLTKPVAYNNNGKTSYILGVNINPGNSKVTGVELELTFDPQVLQNVDVKQSSFLNNPTVLLKKVDEQKGTISYHLVPSSDSRPSAGQGSVAFITFDEKQGATGQTKINFSPETVVTAPGIAQSILGQGTGIIFTLNAK